MSDEFSDSWQDRPPLMWTYEDVESAMRQFRGKRPAVPRGLVAALWSYWVSQSAGKSLFGDENDLGLFLHARALEVWVPGSDLPLKDLPERVDEHGTLMPEPLTWGPRAALAPQVRVALSSSLITAWVTVDDQGPVEALVVGEGLPEIRRQVVQSAFTAALRINGLADPDQSGYVGDLMSVGAIRVVVGTSTHRTAGDLPPFLGARQVVTPAGELPSARGALQDFVALLRKLERETNLVQVWELSSEETDSFDEVLRSLPGRAKEQVLFRGPTEGDDLEASPTGVVTIVPYLHIPTRRAMELRLSPDLLDTKAYQQLEVAHQRALVDRLTMDARLRRDYLQEEIRRFRAEREAFMDATEEEQHTLWDHTVLLVERFDERMGITIRLAEPEERDTKLYYEFDVPHIIKVRVEWEKRMTQLAHDLETVAGKPHAPARQLALARFLDAALRGVAPDESPATTSAFNLWRKDVVPMLWFEWRSFFTKWGIAADDVMTRHTLFLTRHLPSGDDTVMVVQPHTLVDQCRSAVLADARRGVVVVRDATDHAVPQHPGGVDPAEEERRADTAWGELVSLATESKISEEAFADRFIHALREHPREVISRVVQELRPIEPPGAQAAEIDANLHAAQRATAFAVGMERALIAMQADAFLTARDVLDNIPATDRNARARAELLRAIVECLAADMEYREISDALASVQESGLPLSALRAFGEASDLDQTYTEEWLSALPNTELNKAIRRLFQGLPRARRTCNDRQYAVWLFRQAIESAGLALALERSVEDLSEDEEAVDAVLVKVGQALERVLVGEFVSSSRAEGLGLLEVLTGRARPKYGRVR